MEYSNCTLFREGASLNHPLGSSLEFVRWKTASVPLFRRSQQSQTVSVSCSRSGSVHCAQFAGSPNFIHTGLRHKGSFPARCMAAASTTRRISSTYPGIETALAPLLTPGEISKAAGALKPDFKVLLVSDANNCMTQRAWLELTEMGVEVHTHFFTSPEDMVRAARLTQPDLIICPFLTKRIPAEIYENKSVPCLIIHPGPEGDRGMSSLDWALLENEPEWGVTLLQAEKEMDAGAIWSTHNFAINKSQPPTKSGLYRTECINAAMKGIHDVLEMIARGSPQPRPLDYSNPRVRGRSREKMVQTDRKIDWTLPAADIARIIRASDSQPGVLDSIGGENVLLFGAHVEANLPVECSTFPAKSIVGKRHGAVLLTCGSDSKREGLWITHMRKPNVGKTKNIKLPATVVLPSDLVEGLVELPEPRLLVSFGQFPETFQEIFTWEKKGVCYLWFNFYNGAMNTDQCTRLAGTLQEIKQSGNAKVVVLMGGPNFFSNGINLNTIEAAGSDSFQESWQNINAIDDFVQEVLTAKDVLTVSVIAGNAGAGGVMAAISADEVWTHENVILNPHYKSMALFGSEYWTYSLNKRVGEQKTTEITDNTLPMSASTALQIGLVDQVLNGCASQNEFLLRVIERAEVLASDPDFNHRVSDKKAVIDNDAFKQEIQRCRDTELQQMQQCLASSEFDANRHAFVFKIRSGKSCLPARRVAKFQASMSTFRLLESTTT